VLATDPATGKSSAEPVTAVIRGHPFYDVTRASWVTAGQLRRDAMSASDEQDSRVKGLTGAGLSYQKHMGRASCRWFRAASSTARASSCWMIF
jgi:hypothetical protein